MATKAERLRQARKDAGFDSASAAAESFGWQASAYRHHENGTRGFGPDAAKKYGRAFRVTPGWLLGLDNVNKGTRGEQTEEALLVNGSVEAGAWRESSEWNDERSFEINWPSPFPGTKRFGLVVVGLSMSTYYEPETVLDCISIYKDGPSPQTGDHVVVQRTRPDGLREMTVKEYREEDGKFMLVPRSEKNTFEALAYTGPDRDADTDSERVEVIGFVIAAYPPRTLDLMRRMGAIRQRAA